MACHGFFEIPDGARGARLGRLLAAAYRASHDAPVFIWLKGTDTDEANRLLTPVVAELGVRYSGVEFVRKEEETRALRLADTAAFRVVFSDRTQELEVSAVP